MAAAVTNQVVCVALFGCGRIGQLHLNNLISLPNLFRVAYIIDGNPSYVVDKFGSHFEVLRPEDDFKVFTDQSVSSVLVCTPTRLHAPIITRALNAGKHVFAEKPLAADLKDIKRLYKLATDKGLHIHCSLNRRFDESFDTIREAVQRKELGQIYSIYTISRDADPPSTEYLRASGNIFHDSAVHDIDLICSTLNEFPESVVVQGQAVDPRFKEFNDFDSVSIGLKFPSGALGNVMLTRYSSYGWDHRLEVHGEHGTLLSKNASTFKSSGPISNKHLNSRFSDDEHYFLRFQQSYMSSMKHFHYLVQGAGQSEDGDVKSERVKAIVKGSEVISVHEIVEACDLSASSGRQVSINYSHKT